MHYTTLGRRSGLRVSEIALGTSNFGTKWPTGADQATSRQIFDKFAEAGGTFIDTADTYQQGESEEFLADFLATDREHFTVATKYTFGTSGQTGVGKTGNSRKAMRHAVDRSLSRMKTEYIDILWTHAPDFVTPIEEIVESFDDLVRAGKILAGGLSNFPAWQVATAVTRAAGYGRSPIIATQFEYSLAARDGERELLPMAESLGVAALLYSPLGGGLLTGKYRQSAEGRLTTMNSIIQREDTAQKTAIVDELLSISKETGVAPAELSIAWLLQRGEEMSTAVVPIIGPRSVEQLESYLRAVDTRLSDEHFARLASVSAPALGIPQVGASAIAPAVLGGSPANFLRADGRPLF